MYIKGTQAPILANFLCTRFMILLTFGYTGVIPENIMSKGSLSILRMKIVFLANQYGCVTFLQNKNTKRLISPEREGFRGSNFVTFIL